MASDDMLWFKSKVDWWIAVLLVALPLVEIAALAASLWQGDGEALIASLVGCAIVAAIYGLLVIPVRYGVAHDELLVRFGVVRQHIRFDSIVEVRPTHVPLSSAALSLDRLAIRTGRGPLNLTLISPVDKQEFIALLASRARLTWDGQHWVRADQRIRRVRQAID